MTAPDTTELPLGTSDEPPVWTPDRGGGVPDDAAPGGGPARAGEPAAEVDPDLRRVRAATVPVRAGRRQSRAVPALLAIGVFVAVAGLGFAVGRVSVPGGTGATAQTQNGALGPGGDAGFGPGGSFVPGAAGGGRGGAGATIEGTVVSVGEGTMTVRLANGSTVTIATTSSTTYHGQQAASQSDVAAGQTVTVQVAAGGATASGVPASGATASGATTTRTATDVTIAGR